MTSPRHQRFNTPVGRPRRPVSQNKSFGAIRRKTLREEIRATFLGKFLHRNIWCTVRGPAKPIFFARPGKVQSPCTAGLAAGLGPACASGMHRGHSNDGCFGKLGCLDATHMTAGARSAGRGIKYPSFLVTVDSDPARRTNTTRITLSKFVGSVAVRPSPIPVTIQI